MTVRIPQFSMQPQNLMPLLRSYPVDSWRLPRSGEAAALLLIMYLAQAEQLWEGASFEDVAFRSFAAKNRSSELLPPGLRGEWTAENWPGTLSALTSFGYARASSGATYQVMGKLAHELIQIFRSGGR